MSPSMSRLKIALMGPLAQVGLALATSIGAWINFLLVLGFAARAGYLELDRVLHAIAWRGSSYPASSWSRAVAYRTICNVYFAQ